MQGAGFTISSLGGIGGTAFTPIINSPEVAILGVSRSAMRAVYHEGGFVPRLMLPLSLSYDHRVIDGAMAARFTSFLAQHARRAARAHRGGAVSVDLLVPDLGNFSNVEVVDVLVKPGDVVEVDTPLVTLETDKASLDVPATGAGKITEVLLKRGDKVSKGSLIARLEGRAPAGAAPSDPPAAPAAPPPARRASPRTAQLRPQRAAAAGDTRAHAGRWRYARPAANEGAEPHAAQLLVLGSGSRRLHGGLPRRGSGAQGDAGRARRGPRRGMPQRRLHSLQGAAACGQGDRGCPGDGRARHLLRRAPDRAAKLRAWKCAIVAKLTGGLKVLARQRKVEIVRGTGRFRQPERHGSDGRRRLRAHPLRAVHHRRRLRGGAAARACRRIRASSTPPARWSCRRSTAGCWSSAAASSAWRWPACSMRSARA